MASKIKAFVTSALASLGVGAGVTYGTKQTMTETTENVVKLSDQTVNNDILFQAIQLKNQKYNLYNCDLSVRSEWLDLANKLVEDGQPGWAENVLMDYYTFTQIERGDMRFPEFLDQEKLTQYVTQQDSTQTLREQVTDFIHDSIQTDYGVDLQNQKLDDSYEIAAQVKQMDNPSDVGDLMEKIDLWNAWKGNNNYDVDFDRYLRYDYSSDELANMSITEKAELVMKELDKHKPSDSGPGGGYTPEALLDYAKSLSDSSQDKAELEVAVYEYRDYMYAKGVVEGKYQNVEINDVVSTFGHSPELDVSADAIRESREDILSDAIEEKFNLPDGSVSFYTLKRDIPESVPASNKDELANNILDSSSYVVNMNHPLPTDLTTTEQIETLGVRDQVDDMINAGVTIDLGSITQPISDATSIKLGGIFTCITLGALLIVNYFRSRKINKICAENPEAAEEYRKYMASGKEFSEYMDEKREKVLLDKAVKKRIKEIAKIVEEAEAEANEEQQMKL